MKARILAGKYGTLYLMLLPAMIYLLLFNYIPMYGVTIAFKNFSAVKGILGSPWAGLRQFNRVFSSPNFAPLLSNTLTLSLYQLLVTFPLPIILALLLNSCYSKRTSNLLKTITYSPYFVSPE